MFKIWLSLFLLASVTMAQSSIDYNQSDENIEMNDGSVSSSEEMDNDSYEIRHEDKKDEWQPIVTNDAITLQMASFAARQISTKNNRLKLASLDSGLEKVNDDNSKEYKLKVTFQRYVLGAPINPKDVYYCTVDMKADSNNKKWSMESYGCTLPAPVRRRRPQVASTNYKPNEDLIEELQSNDLNEQSTNKLQPQKSYGMPSYYQKYKYSAPMDNTIEDSSKSNSYYEVRYPIKRQTNPIWTRQQPMMTMPVYQQHYPTYYYAPPTMAHYRPLYYY